VREAIWVNPLEHLPKYPSVAIVGGSSHFNGLTLFSLGANMAGEEDFFDKTKTSLLNEVVLKVPPTCARNKHMRNMKLWHYEKLANFVTTKSHTSIYGSFPMNSNMKTSRNDVEWWSR